MSSLPLEITFELKLNFKNLFMQQYFLNKTISFILKTTDCSIWPDDVMPGETSSKCPNRFGINACMNLWPGKDFSQDWKLALHQPLCQKPLPPEQSDHLLLPMFMTHDSLTRRYRFLFLCEGRRPSPRRDPPYLLNVPKQTVEGPSPRWETVQRMVRSLEHSCGSRLEAM